MKFILFFLACAPWVVGSPSVITYSETGDLTANSLSVPYFNPSLGTLTGVQLSFGVTVSGNVGAPPPGFIWDGFSFWGVQPGVGFVTPSTASPIIVSDTTGPISGVYPISPFGGDWSDPISDVCR